jgi:hypothetical protein
MATPKRRSRAATPSLPPIPKQRRIPRASIAEAIRGTADVLRDAMYTLAANIEEGDSGEQQ